MSKSFKANPAVRHLIELPLRLNLDDTVLEKFMKGGGRIWCRAPSALQVYFRIVDFDYSGHELQRKYLAESRSFSFIALNQRAVKEVLWLGEAEINESEKIGRLSEYGGLEDKGVSEVALETMVANLRSSEHRSLQYVTQERRIHSKTESFVLAKQAPARDQGFQYREVSESSFRVRINDLFVTESDYQNFLAADFIEPDQDKKRPDWMPPLLRTLNKYSDLHAVLTSKNYNKDDLASEASRLNSGLAAALGESEEKSQKMVAAKRIILGKPTFHPRHPVQPRDGEDKVSLLDVANSLARHFWKGDVDSTKRKYGNIGAFNDELSEILKDHDVDRRASLLPHLSRFIRFTD